MNKAWTELKSIISDNGYRPYMFLSLIDSDGNIVSANSYMQKILHFESNRNRKNNIFQMLHPGHVDAFRKAMDDSRYNGTYSTAELYLKNGHYHPVKWGINYLGSSKGPKGSSFLCTGYKLVDDERLNKFTELGRTNYQLIVESLSAGILVQDTRGELIAANQKAAEIFGVTLERLYQLTDIEHMWNTAWEITREDGSLVLFASTPFMKALNEGKMQSELLVVKLRNGEYRSLLFNCQPLFENDSGLPYSVVSNIVDVTREKQLVGYARESSNLFQSFMNRTPSLAWVLDEDATLLFASQSWYNYFGLTEDTALSKKIFELIPAVVAEALYAKHMHVLETGESVETEEKVRWADGSFFVFHINIFPVEGTDGRKMVGGHAVNLSEKYLIQKQLREANDRLLMLTRTTTDAIWEWDMQTGKIFRNEALMDMIGYHLEEPKGLSWWLRRIHSDDRNRVSDKVKDITEKNLLSWEDEYRFKCADGKYKHMRDKGFVVYENGLPVKMIGSLQDVNELKELETKLLNEEVRRQREISETMIRAQEKERTRIGHELHDNVNQILSTTKLFIDILNPANDDDKQIKDKCLSYLMTAIEEIRKLSKELVVPQLKDNGLVKSIMDLIEDLKISTSLDINFLYDAEIDLLPAGKKVTLFRIVQEQVKNIIRHSKANNMEILLQKKDNDVLLIIKDDGIGFNSKQSSKGIGLSNIYERARFYNGTASIKSAKGKGCQLEVRIPYFEDQRQEAQ